MKVLTYDPVTTHRLHVVPREPGLALGLSVDALHRGYARAAYHWAAYAAPEGSGRFLGPYLRAVARAEDGAQGFARELAAVGLADSLAPPLALQALEGSPDSVHTLGFAIVLRRPLTAAAHLECADSLERRGAPLLAGLEAYMATRLAPESGVAHARLGLLLAKQEAGDWGRPALERALALGGPMELMAAARAALDTLPRRP